MNWLRAAGRGLVGLFVDDGSLAVAVLIWIGLAWAALPRVGLPPVWPPVILFGGLAAILLESVKRRARHRA